MGVRKSFDYLFIWSVLEMEARADSSRMPDHHRCNWPLNINTIKCNNNEEDYCYSDRNQNAFRKWNENEIVAPTIACLLTHEDISNVHKYILVAIFMTYLLVWIKIKWVSNACRYRIAAGLFGYIVAGWERSEAFFFVNSQCAQQSISTRGSIGFSLARSLCFLLPPISNFNSNK